MQITQIRTQNSTYLPGSGFKMAAGTPEIGEQVCIIAIGLYYSRIIQLYKSQTTNN